MATIPCPSCNRQIHQCAEVCPGCGYRGEGHDLREFLGSLGTVGSILLGFGLSSLVELETNSRSDDAPLSTVEYSASMAWLFSSIALLVVVALASFLRLRTHGLPIQSSKKDVDNLLRNCNCLLCLFLLAMPIMGVGIVVFGFSFSDAHGYVGLGAAILVIAVGVTVVLRRRVTRKDELT